MARSERSSPKFYTGDPGHQFVNHEIAASRSLSRESGLLAMTGEQIFYETIIIKVEYVPAGKRKIIVQEEKRARILVNEGHYKTIKTPGQWKSVARITAMGLTGKEWVPGGEKQVWVEPVYKEIVVHPKYQESEERRGRFVILKND